jgi:uncharacterized membrane protein
MLVDELRELRREQHEMREGIADLREAVARLESETTGSHKRPRALMRDGGLTISAATIGGVVLWLIQHLAVK